MAINYSLVSEKVFNLLKGYGFVVKSFDREGKLVIDPQEASRFVVADPNLLVRVDSATEMLVFASGQGYEDDQLRKALKNISNDYLLSFDYKKFNKTIKPKSEKIDIAQSSEKDMADVMEGLGPMTGSTRTSYQPVDAVKIVVKHKKPVNEEVRGSRSRNIHSIYIQRGEEKFRMQENSLKAARAMARHINMGGEMFDTVGTAITEMAEEERKLKEFVRYVQSKKLVNEDNQEFVTLALENIEYIKETFRKITGVKTYATAIDEMANRQSAELLNDDIDLEAKFTETHFDQRVENAMGAIKSALSRKTNFERSIDEAVKKETFSNLSEMVSESEGLEFSSPRAKLGYQVSQMSSTVQDQRLGSYLSNIGKKLYDGASINQHEYTTIKSCLLGAHSNNQVSTSVAESVEARYEQFLEQFDIL